MNVLYVRVSTVEQNTDRQKISEKDFDYVIEDRCSGAIPFFERPGGKQALNYIQKNLLTTLSVYQIDRLGRNLLDILHTIQFFTERKICIHFVAQGLRTLNSDKTENTVTKLICSVLGTVSEMERSQSRERQLEGIKLAKARGVYKGRKAESKEDVLKFLSKPKNRKALEYLKKGYTGEEAATLSGLHKNTICKIRKFANL